MNILIVHNYYQVPGGEDTVIKNEKNLLEKNGHNVYLYTRNNSEIKGMSFFRKCLLPIVAIFSIKTFLEIKKIIKTNHINVIHVHNTLALISPSVYYAGVSQGVPVVQTIHNFRLLCPGATFYRNGEICEKCLEKGLGCSVKYACYRGSKSQTALCVVSMIVHRMTGIYKKINYICLTDFNKKKLLESSQFPKDKIYVKPNFVPNFTFEEIGIKRKEQLLFVGRLDKLKGIVFLLQAWKKYEDKFGQDIPQLLIYGSGPLENWCRKFIENNHLSKVSMKGFLNHNKVREVMAESQALILPTQWYEGFPMTIVEAYSVGTPVIGSNIGNVGNLIEQGVTGYTFTLNDSEALYRAIKGLSQIENVNVRAEYNNKYSEISNYETLLKIYKIVMERTG